MPSYLTTNALGRRWTTLSAVPLYVGSAFGVVFPIELPAVPPPALGSNWLRPLRFGPCETRHETLPGHCPLELCEHAEHLGHRAAGVRTGYALTEPQLAAPALDNARQRLGGAQAGRRKLGKQFGRGEADLGQKPILVVCESLDRRSKPRRASGQTFDSRPVTPALSSLPAISLRPYRGVPASVELAVDQFFDELTRPSPHFGLNRI